MHRRTDRNRIRDEEEIVFVPEAVVGLVIGRKGTRISALKCETNCRICVDTDHPNEIGEIPIYVRGSAENRAKAIAEVKIIAGISEKDPRKDNLRGNQQISSPEDDYDSTNPMVENLSRKEMKVLKNFYEETESVSDQSPEVARDFRAANGNIRVYDSYGQYAVAIPNPVETFEDALGPFPELLEKMVDDFVSPLPIQSQILPILLSGKDLLVVGNRGIGKTTAVLLSVLVHVGGQKKEHGEIPSPTAVIFTPTRESAFEIESQLKTLPCKRIKSCVVDEDSTADDLKHIHILISTPNNIRQLIFKRPGQNLIVSDVSYLVFHEVETMLEKGFEKNISDTFANVRTDKQVVMTSDTWPQDVDGLARSFFQEALLVRVRTVNEDVYYQVQHRFQFIRADRRLPFLKKFLDDFAEDDRKILVFFNSSTALDAVASALRRDGMSVETYHADIPRKEREISLKAFMNGYVRVLLACDPATKFAQIEDITHVVNFDFTEEIEDYVDRVERTAFDGRVGFAYSFLTEPDVRHAQGIIELLEIAGQYVPLELQEMAEIYARGQRIGGTNDNILLCNAVFRQYPLENDGDS
ncbi:unnamed protein product [Notodromas monacha]|uniref:RNA helicase n=1 Tax=Notodromas monacha TaxID=399045 RepID=A0A7R9GAE3_9CRUS|nr:unnamed protein product [Notodromas monacha]CAG0915250.1 unnamed protein product [Notodromas monacha]